MDLFELVQSRTPLITFSQGKLHTFIQLHFLCSPFFSLLFDATNSGLVTGTCARLSTLRHSIHTQVITSGIFLSPPCLHTLFLDHVLPDDLLKSKYLTLKIC